VRPGSEFFTEPSEPLQRLVAVLRSYFVEERSAEEVAERQV